ncbi:Lysophospholipase, alpha-beta hydrolase superfamily [Clostridium collagenovorans DSM 3089]|uniref:Lysophospholipase, alpha-beta hydrolase superfamily n=1 Tax=Clostridium collagenovorans DSM 3089 TaxID=1121306 RepID=A0A1M5XYI3_9CLOT|nr:Lysophospholipase, alpha-beta hydrolase superfamily [Clostridium collagenovorans DSM 3089]
MFTVCLSIIYLKSISKNNFNYDKISSKLFLNKGSGFVGHSYFNFQGELGQEIFVNQWTPEEGVELRGAIQIAHGASEHSYRYNEIAQYLNQFGYIVYANDHRGHGKTATSEKELGFFDYEDGWFKVVEDMHSLNEIIKSNHEELPIFLMGHSMGSFLTRTYITLYGKELNGAIISGTGQQPKIAIHTGKIIGKFEVNRVGVNKVSKLMQNLTFGGFNKKFRPNKTDFDWLTRDEKEVDKFIKDKRCGQDFTSGCILDLLNGLSYLRDEKNMNRIPKELPIFIFSGDKDPVGDMGKGVKKLRKQYEDLGIKDIQFKLYPEGRHEMLNEINKQEVYEDIRSWLDRHL